MQNIVRGRARKYWIICWVIDTNRQMKMGVKVEREHKDTVEFIRKFFKKNKRLPTNNEIYKSIAVDHLEEDPNYYTKLMKCKL